MGKAEEQKIATVSSPPLQTGLEKGVGGVRGLLPFLLSFGTI